MERCVWVDGQPIFWVLKMFCFMILTRVLQHGGKCFSFCSSSSDNIALLSGSIMFSGSPGGKSAVQTSCQKKILIPFKDLPCFQKFPIQVTKTDRKAVIEVPWNCCM